jgi:threonine dehydratase
MISLQEIQTASQNLKNVAKVSPLEYSERLSKIYNANIYLKREDLQTVRSFKIRGAYNYIFSLSDEEKSKGVVCASSGNHAQGFAYSCAKLQIKGIVFMPTVTPDQKVQKVKYFGGKYIQVILTGKTFDETSKTCQDYSVEHNMVYIHPYNHLKTIAGQGTIGLEISDQAKEQGVESVDFVVCAIGGGGLSGGVGSWFKQTSPSTKIIGVESEGTRSMHQSFAQNKPVKINSSETFCDGIAVMQTNPSNFELCKEVVDEIFVVAEGKVATDMLEIYQKDGIITEPSGALPVSCLDSIKEQIVGKNVVLVICGGNNDIARYPDIIERSLVWQGKKKYFIINFAQKSGQLRELLNNVLSVNDDITRFEYIKKTNREKGPALVGIELGDSQNYPTLLENLTKYGIDYQEIMTDDLIYKYLV